MRFQLIADSFDNRIFSGVDNAVASLSAVIGQRQ